MPLSRLDAWFSFGFGLAYLAIAAAWIVEGSWGWSLAWTPIGVGWLCLARCKFIALREMRADA